MNCSADKIGTINQKPAHANSLSTLPGPGCVLYLPGLPGGGSKIYDRSPYGNVGTITGATWRRLPSGLWYLDFDGTDDYVNCGTHSSLDITDAITIKLWAYIDPAGGMNGSYGYLLSKATGGTADGGYAIFFDDRGAALPTNAISFFVIASDASVGQVNPDNTIPSAGWYHIVGTHNKNLGGTKQVKLFVNAVEKGTADFSKAIATNSYSLKISAVSWDTSPYYRNEGTAYITLVEIYNRDWTALEIQNSFNREKHLFGVW